MVVCCPKGPETKTEIAGIRIDTAKPHIPRRIAAEKCKQYQQSTCIEDPSPIERGNGDVNFKEFPHAVVLGYINPSNLSEGIKYVCSGSVISDNFVLTAASCTKPSGNYILKYVRLGDLDYISDRYDPNAQQFNVIQIIQHPHFHKKYNDIALLKLEHPLVFKEHIGPICLSSWNEKVTENLTVAGWGQIDYAGGINSHLQRVRQMLVPHAECTEHYADRITSALDKGIVNETQLCAMAKLGEPDACQGFSGAALFSADRKQSCLHEMVGITSFGISCGAGQPGVYTRVEAYLDWIEDIVWNNGNGSTVVMATPEPPITTEAVPSIASRIHVQKCAEYQKTIGTFATRDDTYTYEVNCPKDLLVTDYVLGGKNAGPKEFPHMVAIGFDNFNVPGNISWNCGGTLISEQFVLTAAHCLRTTRDLGPPKYVLLGDLDYANDADLAEPIQIDIERLIYAPKYNRAFKYDDIGLIKLKIPVNFTDYVRPACLPESETIAIGVTATGWGRLESESRKTSTYLQKVVLDLFPHDQCDAIYRELYANASELNRGIRRDLQLCARSPEGKKGDTCQGDSGGPLQTVHEKHACMFGSSFDLYTCIRLYRLDRRRSLAEEFELRNIAIFRGLLSFSVFSN